MYRVVWEIDLDADNAEDAARQALAIQRKPNSSAVVFDVRSPDGTSVRVDLSDRMTLDDIDGVRNAR